MKQPLRVLFVDDHNASRSRMAEGILRAQGSDDFGVSSAGVAPQAIDPRTRELMTRFNMEPGAEQGRSLDQLADQQWDFVIVLRDEQSNEPMPQISTTPAPISWDIPDPTAATGSDEELDQSYRRIFELLRQRIQVFMLAQHDELRERGSDQVIGARQPAE